MLLVVFLSNGGADFLARSLATKVNQNKGDYEELEGLDDIKSKTAIVFDRSASKAIMGKNAYDKAYPASLTKMMTNLIALERLDNLDDRVEITDEILNYCNRNGLALSGFLPGDKPKLKDLIYGSLLESGAESTLALANYIAGSEEEFVKLMNERASQLGMDSTHFSNATGNSSNENYSTAYDMAILLDQALENKAFRKVITSRNYRAYSINGILSTKEIDSRLFRNISNSGFKDSPIMGGKTGYTKSAGLCLASLGKINGREYIVVTMGAPGDSTTVQWNIDDTIKIYEKIR